MPLARLQRSSATISKRNDQRAPFNGKSKKDIYTSSAAGGAAGSKASYGIGFEDVGSIEAAQPAADPPENPAGKAHCDWMSQPDVSYSTRLFGRAVSTAGGQLSDAAGGNRCAPLTAALAAQAAERTASLSTTSQRASSDRFCGAPTLRRANRGPSRRGRTGLASNL